MKLLITIFENFATKVSKKCEKLSLAVNLTIFE